MPATENAFLAEVNPLLVWQIADSAFPCGGFVHSGGLEANLQFAQVQAESLSEWLEVQLVATTQATLSFVFAAYDDPECLAAVDRAIHAFVNNPIVSRASRSQGQALMASLVGIFDCPGLVELSSVTRRSHSHFGPVFGAGMALLGLDRGETGRLYLFICLRGWISAALRLGMVGPIEAQKIQAQLSRRIDRLAVAAAQMEIEDAAQTAPLLEILQGGHDRLYSRLFQS